MTSRGEDIRPKGASTRPPFLHEKVAQVYYAHGLFCSSYPTTVVAAAIAVALLCCYPLINLPLPGNLPLQVWGTGTNTTVGGTILAEPPWFYVQQVILRTAVIPWEPELALGDAFRAPLYEAFKLLEVVRNYQDPKSLKTLGHVCLHIEAVKKAKDYKDNVLPEYSCLVLSPANFWHHDVHKFAQDTSILTTIFNQQGIQKGKVSIAEMLFGMHLTDAGIKRYPFRNRQRILQYALTMFLKEYDEQFIIGLKNKLHSVYSLHQSINLSNTQNDNILNNTVHIYYPGDFNYYELIPIAISFLLLFIYYYFSIRKIEYIKSKVGMAFTAMATVLGSLSMSLGVCFFFGLTLSLQGKEIYPYLVILVGLENVLVLTKSVASTPPHLDVKIRLAQGLSKEGWSITKNLLLELTVITIGIFTFVPVIQEFCIFSVVGLLTDFFLQIFFFSTVLGIDTRRMENLVEKTNSTLRNNLYQTHLYYDKASSTFSSTVGMHRSKSHPRLSSLHTNIVAGQTQSIQDKKIPKRLRLVNIWARTRFFQRAFMILMITWISMITYNSGIIQQYFLNLHPGEESTHFLHNKIDDFNKNSSNLIFNFNSSVHLMPKLNVNFVTQKPTEIRCHNQSDEQDKLKHFNYNPLLRLSTQHWPSILKKYNISLSGHSIAILPAIKLSYAVSPEQAVLLRNPEEKYGQKFQWQALAVALDPIDFSDAEGGRGSSKRPQFEQPFYPTSPMEIFLTTILCIISIVVLAYGLVVLYRCICPRNYAEWRASWSSDKTEENEEPVLLEAVPMVLQGHPQEVECVATDGFSAVSSCLGGFIKVWDTVTGELLTNIDRKMYFSKFCKSPELTVDYEENNLSDYESGSPPSRDENTSLFPSLQHKINTNFTNLKLQPVTDRSVCKFDFGEEYNQMYRDHNREFKLRRRTSDTIKWVEHQWQFDKIDYEVQSNFCNESDIYEKQGNNTSREKVNYSGDVNLVQRCSANSLTNISDNLKLSPIWCMDCLDNLVAIGCANGRLEFWEATTGKFKCIYDDGSNVGATAIKIIGSRVVVARLFGGLDFLQLQTYNHGQPIDWNFTCAYRRTHLRTSSAGSLSDYKILSQETDNVEDLRCLKVLTTKVHQQPITCLDSEGGRVLTGSQDHTLKVYRLEDGSPLYTLHGHFGPITSLFIDRICPATSGSGSQDGMMCVWDLLTGTCMYSVQAHDGSITSLAYSASYVISLGSDERLCVWERFQGHLLNTISVSHTFPSQVLMLSPHLVVTTRSGSLMVWDVRTGESIRTIVLGHSPFVYVKHMLILRDALLCDFANQLRIIRFPLITHKSD